MSRDKIHEAIKSLEEKLDVEKINLSCMDDSNEAQLLMQQSYVDGMNTMFKYSRDRFIDIQRIMNNDSPKIEEPPKELNDFKMELLKELRQDLRANFQDLLSGMQSSKDKEKLNERLMLLDKKFVNKISAIRVELPNPQVSHGINQTTHGSVINQLINNGQI